MSDKSISISSSSGKSKPATTKRKKAKPIKLVAVLFDETGSMEDMKNEAISGYNLFLRDRREEGHILFSLRFFNTHLIRDVHSNTPIEDVRYLKVQDYAPAAFTNLYDAIGGMIKSLESTINGMKEKPTEVLVVIQTDGEENSSHEYTLQSIQALIDQKRAQGWGFMFLGAGIDAHKTAQQMHLDPNMVMNYTKGQSIMAFSQTSRSARAYLRGDHANAQLTDIDPSARDNPGLLTDGHS